MAHLSDMEELLHKIENEQVRDYMKEALTCYMTKAYRGCIVLSFIALFDDITSKLEKLSGVNKTAKIIFNEVKKRKNEQEVYENYLIDQLKSKKLLTEIDAEFADILRKLRNKSAHPSGHKPSAEEARYVFFEVVDRFLSKPIFSTTHLVDEIIKRLSNSIFFVDTKVNQINEVVKEEIKSLHIEAVPLLVNKLLTSFLSEDKKTSSNAHLFISGLAYKANDQVTEILIKNVIESKSDNSKFSKIVLAILALKPDIYKKILNIYRERLKANILDKIENDNLSLNQTKLRHPANVLNKLSTIYSDSEYLDEFSVPLKFIFEKTPTLPKFTSLFKDKPLVFQLYLSVIMTQITSTSFNISNDICEKLTQIEKIYKNEISEQQSFEVLIALLRASDHGTFKAIELVGDEFSSLEITKNRAKAYISSNSKEATAYCKSMTGHKIPDFLS